MHSQRVLSKNGLMPGIAIKSNKAGFLLCNSNLSFSLDCNKYRNRAYRIPEWVVFLLLSFAVEDAEDNIVFEEGQGVKKCKAYDFFFKAIKYRNKNKPKINQK